MTADRPAPRASLTGPPWLGWAYRQTGIAYIEFGLLVSHQIPPQSQLEDIELGAGGEEGAGAAARGRSPGSGDKWVLWQEGGCTEERVAEQLTLSQRDASLREVERGCLAVGRAATPRGGGAAWGLARMRGVGGRGAGLWPRGRGAPLRSVGCCGRGLRK